MALREFVLKSLKAVPSVYPYLGRKAQIFASKQFGTYEALRGDYWARIYDTVYAYLDGNKPITLYRNSMSNLVTDYFQEAAELGWQEGGGELPLDDETQAWLDGRISTETGFIKDLFIGLRDNSIPDYVHEAFARADGYSATLDGIFGEAKMRGSKNITLEFGGEDGAESCPDCQKMKGKHHTIKYILDNDLIPRPGNDAYECKGYKCQHYWFDPKTGARYDG